MAKNFLSIAGALAALAVLLGAFGAHGLKAQLAPDMMAVYQIAVQYHMWHALGLAVIGLAAAHWPHLTLLRRSGWLMVLGVVLFSGSLYILALTGINALGAVTPLGGLAFIAAWSMFAVAMWKAKS